VLKNVNAMVMMKSTFIFGTKVGSNFFAIILHK
jgi:hypothetical protein